MKDKKRRQDPVKKNKKKIRGRSFQEEPTVFFYWLWIKGKHFQKRTVKHSKILFEHGGKKWESGNGISVRKDDTKILGQKGGSGDDTTFIGVCAQFEVHTTHFSLHRQSGSSQRSSGWLHFFSFEWCEKASASRQDKEWKHIFWKERNFLIAHEKVLAQDTQKKTFFLVKFFEKKKKQNS